MIANSRQHAPRLLLDEDGNELFFHFSPDDDPSSAAYPSLPDFAKRPTLKHDKKVLRVYDIPFPLSSLFA